MTPATLLEQIAELVCRQQQAYGFPPDRLPPACSVAVAVDQGDTYEITRIGDATAVVVTGERVTVLATDFFDHREGAAVNDQRNGDAAAQVRAAMIQRRLHGSAPLADQRIDGCPTAAGMRKPRLHP